MEYLVNKKNTLFFSVDNNNYIYFSPNGRIYSINNPFFNDYINVCLEKTDIENTKLSTNELDEINSFFSQEVNKGEILFVTSDPKKKIDLSVLVLNIAGECNLACNYCFARTNNSFSFNNMTVKTALKAVEFMIKNSSNEKEYVISLFGGEPFLRINMLEEFLSTVRRKYPTKKINFSATTNGTILSDKHIKLIKKYNINLLISIDGPKNITDTNRPFLNSTNSSFDKIMNNVSKLKENHINFSYRATIVAGDENLLEIIDFFEKQKILYSIAFAYPAYNNESNFADWNNNNIKILEKQFTELKEYYYKKIEKKEIIYAEYILEHLQTIAKGKNTKVACSAGSGLIAVNEGGDLYSCMNYTSIKETNIGNLYTDVDIKKYKYYGAHNIDELKCKDCNIKHLCGGGCSAEKYTETGNPKTNIEGKCNIEKIAWKNYLELYQKIKNNYPEFIKNIYNHKISYECV